MIVHPGPHDEEAGENTEVRSRFLKEECFIASPPILLYVSTKMLPPEVR